MIISIEKENQSEAEFMSRNFIDKSTKNRAYINALGAELLIKYLKSEGLKIEDLHNMHSISKILEKIDIADVILKNIHIDTRVVFDETQIFIPKSHFEYEIVPDIYVVLKLDNDFESVDFLGYIEANKIDKSKDNAEYYFVDKKDLYSPDTLVNYIKNYSSSREREISEDEMFKGRELSVSLSDHDISDKDFKYLLNLLSVSDDLRNSLLEFDNFELLSYNAVQFLDTTTLDSVPEYLVADDGAFSEQEDQEPEQSEQDEQAEQEVQDEQVEQDELNVLETDLMDSAQELPESEELIETEDNIASDVVIEEEDISSENDESVELSGYEEQESQDISPSDEIVEDTQTQDEISDLELDDIEMSLDDDIFDENMMNDDEQIHEDKKDSGVKTKENLGGIVAGAAIAGSGMLGGAAAAAAVNEMNFTTATEEAIQLAGMASDAMDELNNNTEKISLDDIAQSGVRSEIYDSDDDPEEINIEGEIEDLHEDDSVFDDLVLDELENDVDDKIVEEADIPLNAENTTEVDVEDNIIDEDEMEDINREIKNDEEVINKDSVGSDSIENTEEAITDFEQADNQQIDNILEEGQNQIQENEDDLFGQFVDVSELESASMPAYNEEVNPDENVVDFTDFNNPEEENIGIAADDASSQAPEATVEDDMDQEPVIENSTIISNSNINAGEIPIDINIVNSGDASDAAVEGLENIYNNSDSMQEDSVLQNDVRMVKLAPKNNNSTVKIIGGSVVALALIGALGFGASKMLNKNQEPEPVVDNYTPENTQNVQAEDPNTLNVDQNNVVNKNSKRKEASNMQNPEENISYTQQAQKLAPTAFIEVSKISWEVPDYVSYSPEFKQYFQSAGRSLKIALTSDLLLSTDAPYSSMVKVGVSFSSNGSFDNARMVQSSGSSQVDKIVLQTVNDTLKVLKAPSSLRNDESTTVILKIYF